MTRRLSKRELDRALEDLEEERITTEEVPIQLETTVVYTGWTDRQGNEYDWDRILTGRDRNPEDLEPGDEVFLETTEYNPELE